VRKVYLGTQFELRRKVIDVNDEDARNRGLDG